MQTGREANYWKAVRRPVYALALVVPMMLVYELGASATTARIGTVSVQVRNGADVLLEMLVNKLGLGGFFLTGAIIISTLVVWQVMTGASWRVRPGLLTGMVLESIGYVLLLVFIFGWAGSVLSRMNGQVQMGLFSEVALSLGAGVYEEFVFRMLLIWTLGFLLQLFTGTGRKQAWITAACISALIFSGAHYLGELGDTFSWQSFLQRGFAGLFFAGLFVLRGFGITACTHALYDVLVVIISSVA